MKQILILAVIIFNIPTQSYCQKNQILSFKDWKIDDNKSLVWQRIFEDNSITPGDIISHLKSFSWVRDVEERDGIIFANAINYMMDFRKYPSSWELPYIYRSGKWNWSIAINYKEGKYRVTVSSITFDAGSVSGGYLDVPISGTYDDVILKKNRSSFKPGQLNNLDVFGTDLTANFTMRKKAKNDDW